MYHPSDHLPVRSMVSSLVAGQIAVSVVSLFLLIFTSVLSYYSYSAQARTGIRESLEQLDDVEISNTYKVKPILHEFDFAFRDPRSVVLIKLYSTQYNEAAASVPQDTTTQIEEDNLPEILEDIRADSDFDDLLTDVWVNDDGVHLELRTRNAVEIRRLANAVMVEIRDWWHP
jgi:hypothetical protein